MIRRQYIPRAYQPIVTNHIIDVPRCAVWAGMGLGKSCSTLTALDTLYLSGAETQPTLILGPKRVAQSVWSDEATKWDHLRNIEVSVLVGTEKERIAALKRDVSVYTINYDNLPWLVKHLGNDWPFGIVVSDESTRLKSFRLRQGGTRARALGQVAHKRVRRFIELTGTPSPNGLKDLWGQIWFLDAGQRLGRTYESFMQRWFQAVPGGDGYTQVKPLPFAKEQIEDKLRDLCLSVHAKDYFDLREPIVNNIYVDLPSKARRLYDEMQKKMFAEIEGSPVEAFNAAARTMKCLQLANGAAYIDDAGNWKQTHDAKIEALEDVVEEAAGAPVMVAYHFKSDLSRLMRAFNTGRHLDANPQTIKDWNSGRIPVLFAHPASAGHGLSLQDGGNILVFFGHNWNLEEYQQIIERIGPVRQMQAGHDRPVFIHHIIARDTVDELVMLRREGKREVQSLLLDAMRRRAA